MSDKDKKIEPQDDAQDSAKDGASTDSRDSNSQDAKKKDPSTEQSAADSAFDDAAEESSGSDSSDNTDKPKPPKKSNGSSGIKSIKWFIFLIILAAIAYAVYFGWQQWQDYQSNMQKADRIDQIEQAISQQQNSLQNALSSQKQQIQSLSSQLEENQRYVSQLQNQLRTTQRKIQAQNSEKQNEWLFNEAEYLIREASYKLNFTDDAASIIALLQAADSQLAELNDGSMTQVRQAISQDINNVRGSGNLDIEGIAISIETLKSNVRDLELASVQLDTEQHAEPEATTDADISSWQHFKNSMSQAASKYYTVHQFDESTQPFISPQKDRLLRENILLNLQTSQLAALQNNQALFRSNLSQVKSWVEQYFKQKPASTQAFIQQLDELLGNSVELDLPSQLSSYQLISEISQQKVNRWLNSEQPAATESESETRQDSETDDTEEEPSA